MFFRSIYLIYILRYHFSAAITVKCMNLKPIDQLSVLMLIYGFFCTWPDTTKICFANNINCSLCRYNSYLSNMSKTAGRPIDKWKKYANTREDGKVNNIFISFILHSYPFLQKVECSSCEKTWAVYHATRFKTHLACCLLFSEKYPKETNELKKRLESSSEYSGSDYDSDAAFYPVRHLSFLSFTNVFIFRTLLRLILT